MKTRVLISTAVIVMMLFNGCSKKLINKDIECILTGEVLDRTEGNLFLYRMESSQFDKDTIPFKDHKFSYKTILKAPEVYWLFFEEDEKDGEGFKPISIFLEEGNVHVQLSIGNIFDYQVSGGELNNKLSVQERRRNAIIETRIKNRDRIKALSDSVTKKKLSMQNDSLGKEYQNIPLEYISNNRDLLSAYYLWGLRKSLDIRRLKELSQPLNMAFADSRYVIETVAFIDGLDKNKPGELLTDFRLLNEAGQETAISDIVGKNDLTFILFWSSRCGATDNKLKSFKDVYREHKGKGFEIVGISDDHKIDRWQKAVARNGASWMNLLDYAGEKAVDEYFHAYGHGDLLVDKTGRIIHRNMNSEQLSDYLSQIN